MEADGAMDVDNVLKGEITMLANGEPPEGLEGVREELPEGARLYFDMAMDLLAEGDVDEAVGRFTADRPRTGWQWPLLARGIPTARER